MYTLFKIHDVVGAGAPLARQLIVASFPASTVVFAGGMVSRGAEAERGHFHQ